MSRLTDKIEKIRDQIYELESRLENLECKQRSSDFKRNRKALRKRLVNDPCFRGTYKIMKRIEKLMLSNPGEPIGTLKQTEPGHFVGILCQVTKASEEA